MASVALYENHKKTTFHQRNVEIYMQKRQKYTEIPVVFLSIYEHNANLLPWRETGAKIELIPMNEEGDFDY